MDELDVHGGQDDYSDEDVVHDIKKRASRKKVRNQGVRAGFELVLRDVELMTS